MGCLVLLLMIISPRLALVVVWIFTTLVDRAFTNFIVPLLGLIFLPWTTLIYVLVNTPSEGVTGFGWVLVAFAVLLDIGSYASSGRSGQARYQEA